MELVSIHEKEEAGSKHNFTDCEGNELKFSFQPCKYRKCKGNIVYSIEVDTNVDERSPLSGIIPQKHTHVAVDMCTVPDWKHPWEYLLSDKTLVMKRLKEVKSHMKRDDDRRKKAKELAEMVEV